MREGIIIAEFERLNKLLNALAHHFQLNASGSALYDEALKNLLLKKGIITETELKEQLGEEIRKANEKPEPEAAPEEQQNLVTPTPAEVAKVEETKTV